MVKAMVLFMALAILTVLASAYADEQLRPGEAQTWVRWVVPLPKSITIEGAAEVPVNDIQIVLPQAATELDQCAAAELAEAVAQSSGADLQPQIVEAPTEGFVVTLGRQEGEEAVVAAPRHRDQAYSIRPVRDENGRLSGLRCAALTDVGTYYAVQTLKQLLAAGRGQGAQGRVRLPAVSVDDWPDLEERGEWGGSSLEDLEWMASLKFNLIEAHAELRVDKEGVGHASMPARANLMERGRRHAMRIVPIITHLEQLTHTGLFEAFPQLRGVDAGDSICFARPEIVTVLTQWLTDLGKIPGVFDVMIWLSEEGRGCQCAECKREDRFVNETRACVAAWQEAKKACPRLGLRLLLTQASYPSNDKVLAAVPEGVKVSYYHGGLTYDTSRRPMIYPLLEEYVKQGRWLGVYPTLGANWLIVGPFSNPEFIHFRMTEFVDKGLSCLVGYGVPTNWYYPVNVEGAAEWSWNAHGRTPEEYAAAYAVRHGIADPDKFARWAATLSPVSWDIYGSRFPYLDYYAKNADQVARGLIPLSLGAGIFGEFHSEERFDEDLAACETALALARELGHEPSILETRIIQGYVRIVQAIWKLSQLLQGEKRAADVDRAAVEKWLRQFGEACDSVMALYPQWSEAIAPGLKGAEPQRFWLTVQILERLAERMGPLWDDLGLEDPWKQHRAHMIGQWKTEEFAQQQSQERRLDVTAYITGPGTYVFQPCYTGGSLGLTVFEARLVSYPKDRPQETRDEAADTHDCHAGAWVKGDRYTLTLKDYDPARGYAIIARIRGGVTTNGEFYLRMAR